MYSLGTIFHGIISKFIQKPTVDRVFEEIAQRILVKIDNKAIDYTQEVYGIKLGPFFQNPKQVTNTPSTLKSEPEKKDKTCC